MSHHIRHQGPNNRPSVSRTPHYFRVGLLAAVATCGVAAVMFFMGGKALHGLGATCAGLGLMIAAGWHMLPLNWLRQHDTSRGGQDDTAGES